MTKEQKEYSMRMLLEAGEMISFYYKVMNEKKIDGAQMMNQQIALAGSLMRAFPMPYVEPPPLEKDDLVPNRPGKWGYCRRGDQAMVSVRVEEAKGGELCYFNDAAGRWIPTEKAEGEWGGYLGPLDEEKS